MLLSIHVWDVIDASIACAAVNIFAALYCWSKWAYAVELPGSRRSSTLIWQSLGFGLVEIAFLAAFVKLWMDESNATFVLLRLWEVNSETSISCFLFAEVFYHFKFGWPHPHKRPLTFWSCAVLHSTCLSLGVWQLLKRRFAVLQALPLFMHLQYAVMAIDASRTKTDSMAPTGVRLLEAFILICAFAFASGVIWASHQVTFQCLACVLVICHSGVRSWLRARSGKWKHSGKLERSSFGQNGLWCDEKEQSSSKTDTTTGSEPRSINLTPPQSAALSSRPDSGVGLISLLPTSSSSVSFSSSTTAPSVMNHRYTVGQMQFPASAFSIFRVDDEMVKGYRVMHAFYAQIGNPPIPEAVGLPKAVLDVGTGTGDWALDVKAAHPDTQVLCTDLWAAPPLFHTDVTSYILDANESNWGWHERFDYIHFRDLDCGIRDWETTFKTASKCQRAKGFLGLEQLVSYLPPDDPDPSSIWHALQQALDHIKAQKGLAFVLHDTQEVQRKLESSGYKVVSNGTRSFSVKPGMYTHDGCDLRCAIIELMKGVLIRGWELQPEVANKESLLNRLEMELDHGLTVKVITIIAQKLDKCLPTTRNEKEAL